MARRFRRKYGRRRRARKGDNKVVTKRTLRRTLNRNIEDKQFWGGITSTTLTPTGSVFLLNDSNGLITSLPNTAPGYQGVGGYQHIGNEIMIKRIRLAFTAYTEGLPINETFIRVIVFRVKKNNLRLFNPDQMLLFTGSPLQYHSDMIENNKNMFEIFYDRNHRIGYTGGVSSTPLCEPYSFKFNKYWKNGLKTVYSPDTTVINEAGILENPLFVLIMSNDDSLLTIIRNFTVSTVYQDV